MGVHSGSRASQFQTNTTLLWEAQEGQSGPGSRRNLHVSPPPRRQVPQGPALSREVCVWLVLLAGQAPRPQRRCWTRRGREQGEPPAGPPQPRGAGVGPSSRPVDSGPQHECVHGAPCIGENLLPRMLITELYVLKVSLRVCLETEFPCASGGRTQEQQARVVGNSTRPASRRESSGTEPGGTSVTGRLRPRDPAPGPAHSGRPTAPSAATRTSRLAQSLCHKPNLGLLGVPPFSRLSVIDSECKSCYILFLNFV